MPTPRTALALGVVDRKIYAVGGTSVVQGPGLTTPLRYTTPIATHGRKAPEIPTARVFLGVGTVDDKVYAVGGVAEGLGPAILPTVEEFAPSGLSVTALRKFFTAWGKIKTGN